MDDQYDAVVVGGGPAGLQATLTLARVHRRVLMVDSGSYRNDPAGHMHNVVAHDGTPPAEFRAAARKELAAYDTATVRDDAVTAIAAEGGGFRVELGDEVVRSRGVVLATGVTDGLPDKPGLAELFGSVVAHCPFCHGHEFAGGTVVVQGGPHAARVALMMAPIAARVVVIDDGHEPSDAEVRALADAGVEWRTGSVVSLDPTPSGAVVRADVGPEVAVDGFFVRSSFRQSAPFAEALGLELLASGCVAVDALGRTSRPGVYAAGDLAHLRELPMPLATVLNAAAAGLNAGAACHHDLLAEQVTG